MKQTMTICLLSSLFLHGCGGGGSTSDTKLELGSNFIVSASGFDGGLVVVGKNATTGETFSRDLSAGLSFQLALTKGNWTFAATGWDGGPAAPVRFGGDVYCGFTQRTLAADAEAVRLDLSRASCALPVFSAGHVDTSVTPNTVKRLEAFVTCNSFYTSVPLLTDAPAAKLVAAGTSEYFCDGLPEDLQSKVRGIKVFAVNKETTDTEGKLAAGSPCMVTNNSVVQPMGGQNPYDTTLLRLPLSNVPLAIMTYEDSLCLRPITTFPFRGGLAADYSAEFDKLLLPHSSVAAGVRLILPANNLKRAQSPFMAHMPYLKCWNGGAPKICDNAPASLTKDFHAFTGPNTVLLRDVKTCPPAAALTASATGTVSTPVCTESGDQVQITFQALTPAVGSFAVGPRIYTVQATDSMGPDLDRQDILSTLQRLMGKSSPALPWTFFNVMHSGGDHDHYGPLSFAREMLSPDGPGGLFPVSPTAPSFAQACADAGGERKVQLFDYEDMSLKSYRVEVSNSTVHPGNKYLCDITNPAASSCASGFNKRLRVFDHAVSALSPIVVVELDCATMHGHLEQQETDSDDDRSHEQKEILSWNTTPTGSLAKQRYEHATWSKEYNLSGALLSDHRAMRRVSKTGTDSYELWDYHFQSTDHDQDGTWDQRQRSHQQLVLASNTSCFFSQGASTTNAVTDIILNPAPFPSADEDPSAAPATLAFPIMNSYPQAYASSSLCSGSPFTNLASFAGNDQILDVLPFRSSSMLGTTFTTIFGTSFFTSP